jgi:hypothetical protein
VHEVMLGPIRATLPDIASAKLSSILLLLFAGLLLFGLRLGIGWTLVISAGLGLAFQTLS